MKQQVLIIRSVSFQHLDWVLSEVKRVWPDTSISVLTHAHGREASLQTRSIDELLIYPAKGDFSFWHLKTASFEGKPFNHLIVPFSNCSGAGFDNVMAMAFRIKAGQRWTLPLNGALNRLTWRWWLRFPLLLLLKCVAFMITALSLPFLLVFVAAQLLRSRLGKSLKKNT